jgi:hypothetical protein
MMLMTTAAACAAAAASASELYEDLAEELVDFAAQARAARRLLKRANMRHAVADLPSPLWEAGQCDLQQATVGKDGGGR